MKQSEAKYNKGNTWLFLPNVPKNGKHMRRCTPFEGSGRIGLVFIVVRSLCVSAQDRNKLSPGQYIIITPCVQVITLRLKRASGKGRISPYITGCCINQKWPYQWPYQGNLITLPPTPIFYKSIRDRVYKKETTKTVCTLFPIFIFQFTQNNETVWAGLAVLVELSTVC